MTQLTLPIYNLSGTKAGSITLEASVFNVPANKVLLHQAITHYMANHRAPFAHTKDRSAVAGSGKKPWKQKGTGNARAGSVRSPLWRGGGITFGPNSARNYSLRLPQKMRQAAYRMALSSKVQEENLFVITSLADLDGKTKQWLSQSKNLPKSDTQMLIIDATKQDTADRAIRNIPTHKYVAVTSLTIYDLLRYPVVVVTNDAISALTQRLKVETNTTDEAVTPAKTRSTAKKEVVSAES